MKTLIAALAALLSVASLEAQQKFSSLPIGANLYKYISSIQILVAGNGLSYSAWKSYPYNRDTDGALEAFAAQKLREYASSLQPANEISLYGWEIHADSDGIGGLLPTYNGEAEPTTIAVAPIPDEREQSRFRFLSRNGAWEIPEEVFKKVRFMFPWGIPYYIPEVVDVEINLYLGSRISRFSTRERISDSDNPCELPAIISELTVGRVDIPQEISLAKLSWWERAEITLYTADELFATFVVNRTLNDGKAIRWSNPPPSFFVPPTPKIASLKRAGNTTELVIEGTPDASVSVEWSPSLIGEWQPLNVLVVPLALSANGTGVLTHTSSNAAGFYRVRLSEIRKE